MGRHDVTEFMINAYHGDGRNLQAIDEHESPQLLESALNQIGSVFRSNQFDEQAVRGIDWGRVWMETFPHAYRDRVRSAKNESELKEAAAEIMGSAHDQFFTRCQSEVFTTLGCPAAPYATADCFGRVNRPCSDYDDRKECQIVPIQVDPCCDIGIEGKREVHWVNPGSKYCVKFPLLCETHIGYALNRSLYECRPGAPEFIQDIMESGIRDSFDYTDEIMRVRMLFGMDARMSCPRPFWLDGEQFTSGYQPSQGGKWTNVVCGASYAISECNEALLCAIEQIWDDARDPYTCKPIRCAGDFELAMTRRCTIQDYRRLISSGTRKVNGITAHTDACSPIDMERNVEAREGWNSTVKFSDYVWDELVAFYLNETFDCADSAGVVQTYGPAANQETAEYWASQTYVVSKSFQDTFGWAVDYDVRTEELSGTDTEVYFNEGTMLQKIFSYKRTPFWRRPWLSMLVRGFDPTDTDITD